MPVLGVNAYTVTMLYDKVEEGAVHGWSCQGFLSCIRRFRLACIVHVLQNHCKHIGLL